MRKKIKLAHPCSCSFRTWQFPIVDEKKNLAPCLVLDTFDCAVYPVYTFPGTTKLMFTQERKRGVVLRHYFNS